MKAIVKLDKRGDIDRAFDDMWNKMCKSAKLNYSQSMIVAQYLRDIMTRRIHEIESAVDMGWLIALIEGEKFGTDVKRGATRLMRAHQNAVNARNEGYGKGCVNANGVWDKYDGCGLEHLKVRLARYGVEYDTNL